MLDTHVAWLANQGMNYLATGENPPRLGNQHPNIVPYQVFPTVGDAAVVCIDNVAQVLGIEACRQFGRAYEIAEEHRELAPLGGRGLAVGFECGGGGFRNT
jgi:crotonobetainyl-CoA:carnitine CoA-transferase CaiB-like acyl-CoA transferase